MEFAAKAHGCQNKAQLTDQLHLQTCGKFGPIWQGPGKLDEAVVVLQFQNIEKILGEVSQSDAQNAFEKWLNFGWMDNIQETLVS